MSKMGELYEEMRKANNWDEADRCAYESLIDTEEFVSEWCWRRFKRSPEHDKGYFKTWLDRFNEYQGHPVTSYMDGDSRKHFDILIKERSR